MNKIEFYDLCAKHDWRYSFSDDELAYKAGSTESREILHKLDVHPEFSHIFLSWKNHVNYRIPVMPRPADDERSAPNELSR